MRALILVDLQNDFTPAVTDGHSVATKPTGALAVPDGNAVMAVANRLMPSYEFVVATQDWHPAGHRSFASTHAGHAVGDVIEWRGLQQILWPDHCVQGTSGAALCDALDTSQIDEVVRKGTDPDIDSYSGFHDNGHRQSTGLAALLRSRGVDAVDIMGLATDYCVKFTALDAVGEGFTTRLLREGCRGVELSPGDCQRAVAAMRDAGVMIVEPAKR